MDPKTIITPLSTEDDAQPFNKQHEYNFFLDHEIQQTLLAAAADVDTDPQPTTFVPKGRLRDYDIHPWGSLPVRRTSATCASTSTTLSSAYHRTREPRINYSTRNTVHSLKEIPFSFHHYADRTRYMEQYRRDYTYANLDTSKVSEVQFPVGLPPNADRMLLQTTPCQTGRTEIYTKRHTASSIDFQDQRLDFTSRPMRDFTSVDRLYRSLRNLGEFESQTSGPSSTSKFWTFDANHVLPAEINTIGIGRTRSLGGPAGELVASSVAFSGKEAKHFPANGYPMDDKSV